VIHYVIKEIGTFVQSIFYSSFGVRWSAMRFGILHVPTPKQYDCVLNLDHIQVDERAPIFVKELPIIKEESAYDLRARINELGKTSILQ